MKVYVIYGEKKSKLTVPSSWDGKAVSEVTKLFCTSYNTKNPDAAIIETEVHLETSDGTKIYSNATIGSLLEDRADYYIKAGVYVKEAVVREVETRLRCRNYGCNQFYNEEENTDSSCHHHTAPPIFHDTKKCWSCCMDRTSYDFESFQLLPTCFIGRHSTEVKSVTIAASPNAARVSGDETSSSSSSSEAPTTVLRSIEKYNETNPTAATAAASAVKTITTRKSTRRADGTARCLRKGCQKEFNCAENCDDACVFHRGEPVFHDVAKFWSCCPETKKYEWDDFIAVPGCAIGNHDDGESVLVSN